MSDLILFKIDLYAIESIKLVSCSSCSFKYQPSKLYPSVLEGVIGTTKLQFRQNLDMKSYDAQTLFDEHSGSEKSRWKLRFKVEEADEAFTLALRIPEWVEGEAEVSVNGTASDIKKESGYALIDGIKGSDVIDLFLPSVVKAERLPDMKHLAAFVDGPIVLAGLTDEVDVISGDFDNPSEFLDPVTEHAYDIFVWLQNNYRTKRQPKAIKFMPLYDVKDEAYTLYFEEAKK